MLERATKRYREEDVRKEASRQRDNREVVQCSVLRARKRCIALTSCYLAPHMLCFTKSSGLVAQLVRAPPCHGGGRRFESDLGRSTVKTVGCYNGVLAQLGEHLPYKQRVIGSSPIGPIMMCRCGSIGRAADL